MPLRCQGNIWEGFSGRTHWDPGFFPRSNAKGRGPEEEEKIACIVMANYGTKILYLEERTREAINAGRN
jgi:hypothetical protein